MMTVPFVSPCFSARCICGEILRGVADSRCAVRRESTYKARTLSGSGISAQLRSGETQDAAEPEFLPVHRNGLTAAL